MVRKLRGVQSFRKPFFVMRTAAFAFMRPRMNALIDRDGDSNEMKGMGIVLYPKRDSFLLIGLRYHPNQISQGNISSKLRRGRTGSSSE